MGRFDGLQVVVRLTVSNPASESTSAFGYGVAELCRGVRETGSLYAAAKRMSMSYGKAWRIMRDTEAALGLQLLDRDGARGSTLTEDCNRLLAAYDSIASHLDREANHLIGGLDE